jgi:hypothetical protein
MALTSLMSWARFGLSLALISSLVENVGAARASNEFLGDFHYIGGPAEIGKLNQSIEEVVQKMNIFVRPIARSRLRKPNLPSDRLIVRRDGNRITIERPGRPTVSALADGSAIDWTDPGGEVFRVSHRTDGESLVQVFAGKQSVSTNEFIPTQDGKRLVVRTFIKADRLPVPLKFETTYER